MLGFQRTMNSPRQRLLLTVAAILGAGALILLYALVDPSANPFPRCSFKMLTGLSCPGCGSQRALHALLHGDPAEAFRLNALFVIEIPLIGLLLTSRLPGQRALKLRRMLSSRPFILSLLATIIIWTVVRNIFEI